MYSQQREKNEKQTTGNVTVKERSALGKAADNFFAERFKDAAGYMVKEVVVPAIKSTIANGVSNFVNNVLFGNSGAGYASNYIGPYSKNEKVSYRIGPAQTNLGPANPQRRTPGVGVSNIYFATAEDAYRVLRQLELNIKTYGCARVGDFYDAAGVNADKITSSDYDYGWSNLASAKVESTRDGWTIYLPRPLPTDN